MNEWETRTLESLCSKLTVGHVGSMASQYTKTGIPFLRSLNIKRGKIELSSIKYINVDFHNKLNKTQLHPGDITIVRTGEPGNAAVIPDYLTPANCSDIIIARPKPDVDNQFLCYAINETARDFIRAYTVGAVQQHFNVSSAKNLPIKTPPLNEQQAIAAALGALDDKITVNERITDISEELCQHLVIANSNETPRTTVKEICALKKQQTTPSNLEEPTANHYSLPAFDKGKFPEATNPTSIKSNKFVVTSPSVLISKLNPEIPRVWNIPKVDSIPSLASTEFLVLEPARDISTHELWAVTSQPEFTSHLAARVTGTSKSHQRVRPAEVLTTEVIDPRRLGPVREQISALASQSIAAINESQKLAELRDTLLPQLMSGKLRVKDAEKIVEDNV